MKEWKTLSYTIGELLASHHLFLFIFTFASSWKALRFFCVLTMVVHKSWIINSVSTLLIAVTCLIGDKKMQSPMEPMTKAIIDNSTHGLIGLFSAIIVLADHYEKLHLAVACTMMSSLIDADHFLTARSLKLAVRIACFQRLHNV